MRILFTRFPLESADGGAENQTTWLAEALRSRGHDVSFLGSCPVLLQRFAVLGHAADRLEIGPPPVSLWHALSFSWRENGMRSALIRAMEALPHKPDVLVMLSVSEKIVLTPWAAANGIRVFWVEHDRIGRWLTKNPWLSSLKKVAKNAVILCVSELSRRMYIDLGFHAAKVIAIPNGVPFPPPGFSPHKGNGFHIGCLSRLSPEKGVDVLLQAIAEIPEASLSIVGMGPEEGYLRTLVTHDTARIGTQRITLQHRILDIDAWYASLDVLVLPSSDHDPFGLVAAEAMMRGIATVVTDACGIAGSLQDGSDALVAKAGSVESLAACIRRLSDATFRNAMAKKGTEAARKHFSIDAMTDAYEICFAKSTSFLS